VYLSNMCAEMISRFHLRNPVAGLVIRCFSGSYESFATATRNSAGEGGFSAVFIIHFLPKTLRSALCRSSDDSPGVTSTHIFTSRSPRPYLPLVLYRAFFVRPDPLAKVSGFFTGAKVSSSATSTSSDVSSSISRGWQEFFADSTSLFL